ncbi:MAG: M4 family metallopeptidase [Oscillospiraceae bacterium]|nr:M4 family metallopeptidase [Oscillospiraceae bacterium]
MGRKLYGGIVSLIAIVLIAAIVWDQIPIGSFMPSGSTAADGSSDEGGLDTTTSSVLSDAEDEAPSFGLYANDDFYGLYDIENKILVTSSEEAVAAATELGFCSSDIDVVLDSENVVNGDTYYSLQQIYNGIPVYGHRLHILTDSEGVVWGASSDCVSIESLDTTPSLSESDALSCALEYLGIDEDSESTSSDVSIELTIYMEEDDAPYLAYCLRPTAAVEVLVDANDGSILYERETVAATSTLPVGTEDYSELYMEYDEAAGMYNAIDAVRNFALYDAKGYYTHIVSVDAGLIELRESNWREELKWWETKTVFVSMLTDPYYMSADLFFYDLPIGEDIYCAAALAYDYFNEVLDHKGFNDAGGMTMFVCSAAGDQNGSPTEDIVVDNVLTYSTPTSDIAMILYLDDDGNGKYAEDWNVTVHEYSHAVTTSIVKYENKTLETDALNESFSDVFGELSEAYLTESDPDWENVVRNLAPKLGSTSQFYAYDDTYKNAEKEAREGHYGSTISSYAMYQIWNRWRSEGISVYDSMDIMSHMLYAALSLLPSDAGFTDFGYALVTSAYHMKEQDTVTEQQFQDVCDALENVGILGAETTCTVKVTDAETGEPISGAAVALDVSFVEGSFRLYTDENGKCTFKAFEGTAEYLATVYASGYEDYCGTLVFSEVESDGTAWYSLNIIAMTPVSITVLDSDEVMEQMTKETQLKKQIDSLVDEYGVINTGTETYDVNFTTDRYREAFSSQRIKGLLCADIYDYDSDGTNELMVLRVDPGSFAAGDLDYASTNLIVSVYEPSDTEAVLADEKEMTLYCGVAWAYTSNAFSLFRYASSLGDDYQPADEEYPVWLALDYLYYENTGSKLSYGIVALSYDGKTLSLADGIESIEVPAENYVAMYMAQNDDALTNLTGRIARNGYTGWYDGLKENGDQFYEYDFQSSASGVFADYAEYRDIHYDLLLMRFGLLEETFRSNYGDMNFSSVSGLTEIIGLSPSELYRSNANTEHGMTALCSIQTPWFQGGVTLTCDDNTGLLDSYRY